MSSLASARAHQALSYDVVRAALEPPALEVPRTVETRTAAVAAILRPGEPALGPELLFIRRAERPSDPWSGHMALPGGRYEPHDPDLLATAVRETREEIGLDLDVHGTLLGRLDDAIPGGPRGMMTSLVVEPYVWAVEHVPPLVPSGVEVDELHWVPLLEMLRGDRDTRYPYVFQGQHLELPAYRVGTEEAPRVVWGMTHRMLESLFERIRAVVR